MEFGPEAAALNLVVGLALVREQELQRGALPRLVDDVAAVLVEGGEIDRVALEGDDGGVAAVRLLAMDAALLENQIGLSVRLHRLSAFGEVHDGAALLAPVLHEDAEERVAGPLAVVERDAVIERRELALLDHVGDEIGADLRDEVPQLLEASQASGRSS